MSNEMENEDKEEIEVSPIMRDTEIDFEVFMNQLKHNNNPYRLAILQKVRKEKELNNLLSDSLRKMINTEDLIQKRFILALIRLSKYENIIEFLKELVNDEIG